MDDLINYVEVTTIHAKELVRKAKQLRNEEVFNKIHEISLFASLGAWHRSHQKIELKKQTIILTYEKDNIPCETMIKELQKLHDFIYNELIERELIKLHESINMKFIRFAVESRKLLKFFIENLKELDYKQKNSNLNGFDHLREVISYYSAYLINIESIAKHDLLNNIERAKTRLNLFSNDELSEAIYKKCYWAQKEIEKQLSKGSEGLNQLIRYAIDELDDIYLEFERLKKQYNLDHVDFLFDMLPFINEFNSNFAPFFCWVKSIQTHKSKVAKTVCRKLSDQETRETEPKQDFPLIFHELETYELFLYLVDHYDNDNQVTKFSHLYHFLVGILGGWKTIKKVEYMDYIENNHDVKMSKVLNTNDSYTNNFERRLIALKERFIQENKKE